jgi:flagellar biosynthetic protein FliR
MTATLAELAPALQEMLFLGFVVFLRVGGAMALMPAFGEVSVPMRVRLGLALAFTAAVMPAVAESVGAGRGVPPRAMLTEPLLGLAIGAMLRFFVLALQTAGTIAAQATSLSQLFGGSGGEPQPAIGHILVAAGLALAVMSGLPVKIALLLIASYDVLPPGQMPEVGRILAWGLSGVSASFSLALSIAAPFVIAGLIYNVALGAINRAMPQLMVAFVGAPALTLGGLALLSIALPAGLAFWHATLDGFLAAPFGGPG